MKYFFLVEIRNVIIIPTHKNVMGVINIDDLNVFQYGGCCFL